MYILKCINVHSLIKMMYSTFQKNKQQKLTMGQLQHCLRRNFGGKLNVTGTVNLFVEDIPAKYFRTEGITSENVSSYFLCV